MTLPVSLPVVLPKSGHCPYRKELLRLKKMPKTYCTYQIQVANKERVQVEKWNSLHQPLGEPSGAFRYVAKLNELTPLLSSALNNELNDSSRVRTLGETLFDILFDDVLRQDFVRFYEQVVHQDKQLLRIELDIDEQGMSEVAALPWEFMCLPERANLGTIWLSTAPEVVFSRRRSQYFAAQPIQLQKNEKLRIALVVASPPGLPEVAYEPIEEALETLAQDKAELVELLPVLHSAGLESIDEMLSQRPHIVHFMGHCGLRDDQGKEVGVIALVDPDENEVLWIEAGHFSEQFNQYRPGLVMLQASQSGRLSASQAFAGVASRVVQQNIPVVVAMQYDVSDSIASRFARRFYKQLAEGDPVDIAAQYGRRAISLSPAQYKKRDFATPVIFMRVENGYLFQTYEEEPAAPSPVVEMRRRLEAAMPQRSQVDRPTEVRVMVALHDSPGLRAKLPDVTESGDLIQKNDAVQNDVALEFPVDSKTREPLPINIYVSITAPSFKIEQPAKSIRVSPKYDSGIITFFLTPTIPQKYGRVVVEWFSDEQKNTLLGSLTLITETLESQNQSVEASWKIEKTLFDLRNSKYSDFSIEQKLGSMEGGKLTGIKILAEDIVRQWSDGQLAGNGNELARGEGGVDARAGIVVDADTGVGYRDGKILANVAELNIHKLAQLEMAVITHHSAGNIIINRSIRQNQYFIQDLGNGIGLEMMLIPDGSFIMGSSDEEKAGESHEKPQHSILIQTFCMSKYSITQAQWREIAVLPEVHRELNPDPAYFKGDALPVEQIYWDEAIEFCDRLSLLTGRDYRLPSEAEWEYACRAGSTTPFHFGETVTTDLANYRGTDSYSVESKGIYRAETMNVGSFFANAYGLYDMHGNVWEWCFDHWHDSYQGAPKDGSAWLSEMGNFPRVIRGGSWCDPPANCRSASREKFSPHNRSSMIGFRIVCSAHKSQEIVGVLLDEL
jgi:formylglycine-generating enzyme required for sulfatase activity